LISFSELGLNPSILKALTELGFETPSEIQAQAIPQLLGTSTDFIGLAQTGTGKTAAFGLPLLQNIDPQAKTTQALILAPTRELGQQIAEQLALYGKFLDKMNVLPVYGGASIVNQIKDLKRPQQVVIATPGRLIDLLNRKAIKLNDLKYLVLDEADEMLNMGFKDELDVILSHTPDSKLTWLFSATMPNEIKRIVKNYMSNPAEVRINPKEQVNTSIDHQYCVTRQSDKELALMRFLDLDTELRGVVFCRTKRDTQNLAEELLKEGYRSDALHGDLSQAQRDRVMKRFKSNELQVLIATDVAARGIDVNDLSHVFHMALPDDDAYYTHRSGRTARAGKKGISLVFTTSREQGRIKRLMKNLGIEFTKAQVPGVENIAQQRLMNWCTSIIETDIKKGVDDSIYTIAKETFKELSKEELMAKLLAFEMQKLRLNKAKDLNDTSPPGQDSRGPRRNGGGGGGKRPWDRKGGSGSSRNSGGNRSGGAKGNYRGGSSGGGKSNFKKRFEGKG
jgi:ATP-dependent RNA helicase DeaD